MNIPNRVSETRMKIEQRWTVHNYSNKKKACGVYIETVPFTDQHLKSTWFIRFYPYGTTEAVYDKYASIFLFRDTNAKRNSSLMYIIEASIFFIDANEKEVYAKEIKMESNAFVVGSQKFIKLAHFLTEVVVGQQIRFGIRGVVTFPDTTKPVSNLSIDLGQLLLDETFSDVTFVADGESFRVHRAVLSARCSVFKAMFSHDFEETQSKVVNITDMSSKALKDLISYIYTDKVVNIDETGKELLAAANKYDLGKLHEICSRHFCSKIDVASVCDILVLANYCNAGGLKEEATNYIKVKTDEVFSLAAWESLTKSEPVIAVEVYKEVFKFKTFHSRQLPIRVHVNFPVAISKSEGLVEPIIINNSDCVVINS